MFALKHCIQMLCGFSQMVALLREPYTAWQTVAIPADLIKQRAAAATLGAEDTIPFTYLISDLRALIAEQNRVVHAMWYVGWASEQDTVFSEARGHKFSSRMSFWRSADGLWTRSEP